MLIEAVHIAQSLRGFESDAPSFEVEMSGEFIRRITPLAEPARGTLMSGLVDAHVHLDKTGVVDRVGAAEGDLFAAMERMAACRDAFTADDVRARMSAALAQAHRAGTRALRTHIDWVSAQVPVAFEVWQTQRALWQGKLELQAVSLTPLDVLAEGDAAQRIAQTLVLHNAATQSQSAIMGAFVYRNADLRNKLTHVLLAAKNHGLQLDLHIDEGLDADAVGVHTVAELVIALGMQGQVTCSHACSLSVQPHAQALQTLALCQTAGVHIVTLPTTNAYLQGSWQHTPVERGISRIKELFEQKRHKPSANRACIATDNVADGFFPYGSYDLLDTFALGVQLAHLTPADEALSLITTEPAQLMRLAFDGRIAEGARADLVWTPAANAHELITPAGRALHLRKVWRNGQLLT
jgi:cytosine/creatinine deaminase